MTAAEADETFLAGLAKHRTKFVIQNTVRTAHCHIRHLQQILLALSAAASNEYLERWGTRRTSATVVVGLFEETGLGREQITLVELPVEENGSIV